MATRPERTSYSLYFSTFYHYHSLKDICLLSFSLLGLSIFALHHHRSLRLYQNLSSRLARVRRWRSFERKRRLNLMMLLTCMAGRGPLLRVCANCYTLDG